MKHAKQKALSWTCDECGKAYKQENSLRMHIARAHRGMGPQPGDRVVLRRNGDAETPEAPKRRYTRKQQVVEVAYCPCCGLNLRALGAAISVAMRH